MKENKELAEWLQRAEEDYQLARATLQRKSPMTYGATFHAQQCAEKYIKALLVSRKVAFPRVHDLAALNTLCSQNGIILPMSEDSLEKLSAYAVEVRYPGMQPTLDEAREALEIARAMRKFARKMLSL